MKRFTISFLTLCFALMAAAEPIGKHAALYTAKAFMLSKGKNINQAQTPFKASRHGVTQQTSDEEAYYYVFNAGDNGGYVIVSGDDRVEPILGYVEQGSFDPNNIPENMREMLQMYADEIKFVIDNNIQQDDPRIKKRNKVAGTRHSVGEMLTTRWNQGKPYNITCPDYYKEDDVDEATALPKKSGPATGCTATAMAQVMYFYRYPEKIKKVIPSYSITYTSKKNGTQKTVNIPAIQRNTVIKWDDMQDTYSWEDGHVANAQDSAVANLMRYCGQAVTMHYGPSSGANFSAEAYIEYFGYDQRAWVGERSSFSIDQWFDLIYNEISQGYPVLMSGFSSGGGHAFVLDGFDGDNLFHLNWGWGGGSNGWFLVGILNPGDNSGIGASSSSDGYSMSQRALFSLRLPGTPKSEGYLTVSDVTITHTSIKSKFTNRTGSANGFHTGIMMLDENGELELVGTKQVIASLANGSSQTKTFQIAGKLTEGTYRLSPASKPAKSEEWQAAFDFQTQYIEAVVDSVGGVVLTMKKPIPTNESISVDTITFPGTRIVGKQQEVKVTFRNDGKEYFKTIYLLASKTQQKVYTKSKSQVAVRSGETVDISYFFTPEETGTYNLWLATDDKGNNVIGQGTMEVISEAEAQKASLTVSSYTITNLVNGYAYGKCLVGQAKIKNNKNIDFHGRFKLTIWTQYGGSGSAWGGSSHTYEVDILGGKIATVDFSFDGLGENNKYYLSASYVNQDGELGNGGVWDLGGWTIKPGIAAWKNDGTITGKEYKASMTTPAGTCGVYADCSKKINRMSPNKNPNTIYAFGENMVPPTTLTDYNLVHGKHASHINLINDEPYYLPATFRADSASFTYTFPETEAGTDWHAITMPFAVDSIFLDDQHILLSDTLKHFWIYEFAKEGWNGEIVFKPATTLRGGTPYIIAADSTMAGCSVVFRALNVPFYKTGTDKMVVTSANYKFHGNTYAPKLKNVYILNDEGTAFEYTTAAKALTPMASYFTTELPDSVAPASIVLPDIPVVAVREATLDEMSSEPVIAGTYDVLTLKRTFEAGYNTICLPFAVDDIASVFGQDAQAYEFFGLMGNDINFVKIDTLAAGQPYIIYLPEAISEDIVLSNISIDEESTQPGFVIKDGIHFRGIYHLVTSDIYSMELHKLNADGTLEKYAPGEIINGFRAVFSIPWDEMTLRFYEDATGIVSPLGETEEGVAIFNVAGQRLNKMQKGINIVNGKKVLK
ncbi:MAG: C10 family peptidase [Bacteroidaceae bacterium]|nr:C10 family peptidase [Bacteroidaceae bacterium]